MLSLFLSEIAHIRLPVYVHVHAAIFAATRIAGVVVGIIALGLCTALGFWDTGLNPTPRLRPVEVAAGEIQRG
jgi:hypothetical protein